jgi:hypothetical protein
MLDAALEGFESTEQFLERVNKDERRQWLLENAVEESERASSDQKARALGRALLRGLAADDDAKVDEAPQRMRIIADLEAIDVKVLDLLAKVAYHRTVEIPDLQVRPEPHPEKSPTAYVRVPSWSR